MRYNLLKRNGFVLLSFAFVGVFGQESINSAGGESIGSSGSVSYSIGQIVYSTNSTTTGSEAQGVQQPYEISMLDIEEFDDLNLSAFIYPNPTEDYLILDLKGFDVSTLNYQLFDMTGRVIQSDGIKTEQTKISMQGLPSATYLIKVNDGNKHKRTFRVIKK